MEWHRAAARFTTKTVLALCLFLAATAGTFVTGSSGANAASFDFLTNHQLYDHGVDILSLQEFFNTHGFLIAQSGPGSLGNETSFFGLATFQALKAFQAAHELPSTGYFGPLTRAIINSGDLASSTAVQTTAPNTTTLPTGIVFTHALIEGQSGADIAELQQLLIQQGFLGTGDDTGYFGPLTTKAVAAFQAAHNIDPLGGVGPLTRALLNSLLPTSASSRDTPTTTSAPATTTASTTPSLPPPLPGYAPGQLIFGGGGGGGSTPAATCTLSASPLTILSAATSTLTWTSTNASSASLNQNIGTVATAGSQGVTPTTTTIYTLSVSGGGGSGTCNATVTIDAPPVISAISSTPLTATSTITWTTDKTANSQVVYGITTAYGSTTSNASLLTSHVLTLTSLTGGTTYHFAVVSSDSLGNTSTSTDQTFVSSTTPYIASNGWTVFSPSPGTGSCSADTYTGTCVVYVSASAGNDSTCAAVAPPVNESGVTPCATLLRPRRSCATICPIGCC